MRVVAVHLFNDYSGSPKVLMQLLKGWTKRDVETHLYTCSGREGFLSNIDQVHNHYYWYSFAKNPIVRLLYLSMSQFLLGVKLFFFLKKTDILYINTVLPFGAGIVGKIKGCKIIYHVHETSMKPKILKVFLFGVVKWSAKKVVYVSNFLANQEKMNVNQCVLYNVLENSFVKKADENRAASKENKIVLMICSLKAYKGVNEFLKLAIRNPQFIFKLVVNASEHDINEYFKNDSLPKNFFVYPTQTDTHKFYKEASVILNLSDVKLWVETFGLTILEGMAYGLPAIVPPVGGVVELVDCEINGYLIDSKDIDSVSEKLNTLLTDKEKYRIMSEKSFEKSKLFSETYFENESFDIISKT